MATEEEMEWGPRCEHSLVCSMDAVVKWWGDHHGAGMIVKTYDVFRALQVHCDPGVIELVEKIHRLRAEMIVIRQMMRNGFYYDDESEQVMGTNDAWRSWNLVSLFNDRFAFVI